MKKDFIQLFNTFISENKLCTKKQTILLAVSGGIDSVVLAHAFHKAGYSFGIAHVNFGLRGDESNEDEKFVRQLSKSFKAPFYYSRFNTLKEAGEKKISVQMAARDLRYKWLEETRKNNKYTSIAVAHHLQDLTETVLINMLRGTGIAGLHGILPVHDKIIRPLLFASKEDIETFASENKLNWREDSSNEKDDYTRNLLRHHVLPVFKKINPSYEKTFGENAERFLQSEFIVDDYIGNLIDDITYTNEHGEYVLAKNFFKSHPAAAAILYELLKEFNFTTSVVNDIIKTPGNQSGKLFLSETHQLVFDRDEYIVSEREKERGDAIFMQHDDHMEILHHDFILKIFPMIADEKLYDAILKNKNPNIAYADAELVKLPFGVRTWKKGDYFIPFGMKGKKKISDFYIDLKLSLTEKERTWILTDSEKIIWIMGYRMDNRIAITRHTKNCYRCEFTKL